MHLTLELTDRDQTLAHVANAWDAACRDPFWGQVEGRLESNAFGQMVVNPPPTFEHNDKQHRIARLLEERLGGVSRVEFPVLTVGGMKITDVAWMSQQQYHERKSQPESKACPALCVEVLSPSNVPDELRHKRVLYFDAGASECWECDLDGRMTYYLDGDPDTTHAKSKRCPDFPDTIED